MYILKHWTLIVYKMVNETHKEEFKKYLNMEKLYYDNLSQNDKDNYTSKLF